MKNCDSPDHGIEENNLFSGPSLGQVLSGGASEDELRQLGDDSFVIDDNGHVSLRNAVTGEFPIEPITDVEHGKPADIREIHESPLSLAELIEKGEFASVEGEPSIERIFDTAISELRRFLKEEGGNSSSPMSVEFHEIEEKFGKVEATRMITSALSKLQSARGVICSVIATLPARVAMAGSLGDYARRQQGTPVSMPVHGGGDGGSSAATEEAAQEGASAVDWTNMGIYNAMGLTIANEIVYSLIKKGIADDIIKFAIHAAVMFVIVSVIYPDHPLSSKIATTSIAVIGPNYRKYGEKLGLAPGPFRHEWFKLGISLAAQVLGYTVTL